MNPAPVSNARPIKVAILGAGVVASGVTKVLQRNQAEIKRRAGRGIEIAAVAARNVEKARAAIGDGHRHHNRL